MMPSFSVNRQRRQTTFILVRPKPGNPSQGLLHWGGTVFPCALGRGGTTTRKREGDGATPVGQMRLLYGWYRRDRLISMQSGLALRAISSQDGWCDAPGDRNYNRTVKLPYKASHETMLRKDRLYDCCIVLDYNIKPRKSGLGSAIFFHIAREGYVPTEGCIAVSPRTMARMLPYLSRKTVMIVSR